MSALVRLADPEDETTSECCAAALYLFFCHPDVLALIDGREVQTERFCFYVFTGSRAVCGRGCVGSLALPIIIEETKARDT